MFNSIEYIQDDLLKWFVKNGRHWIPWKLNDDGSPPESGENISPYKVWIAEIMLQQTQLKVVIPYWERWMKTFPHFNDLVAASEQDVLFYWQGLGYYSRAKRIYQSSILLMQYRGNDKTFNYTNWPKSIHQWMSLPGVGRCTAGSIISSSFDLPTPILDGNVKRILIRLIASDKPTNKEEDKLWELSNLLLAKHSPRNFNQALMDLGATVCTSKNPKCSCCPLKNYCLAYIKYDPADFPKKIMKKIIPNQEIGIGLVFNQNSEVLIAQRLESSSMGGLWEFPGGKKESDESIKNAIAREIQEEIGIVADVGDKLLSFKHSYSNKKLNFIVHICEWKSGKPKPLASQKILWVSPNNLLDFPFPAANTKIISALHKYLGMGHENL
tara:strand:+ start:3552 stop:4700 length:1149 start_codon:yes stop_codon:yes gene_type:complete